MSYDDGFSMDLGQALPYKPSFVSPIAVRYGQVNQKPGFVSPLDTRTTRRGQSSTAAALAGCRSCSGMGAVSLPYKMGTTSPIAVRSAPRSQKPDFVSPLDTRMTRAMQTRTAAALAELRPLRRRPGKYLDTSTGRVCDGSDARCPTAEELLKRRVTGMVRPPQYFSNTKRQSFASMFAQFDPSVPITTTSAGARALDVARMQIGLDPMRRASASTRTQDGAVEPSDANGMEMTDEGEVVTDQSFRVCTETMFRNADCSMKALPIVGGLVAGAVILGMLARG